MDMPQKPAANMAKHSGPDRGIHNHASMTAAFFQRCEFGAADQ
jgi:hypothetical protein